MHKYYTHDATIQLATNGSVEPPNSARTAAEPEVHACCSCMSARWRASCVLLICFVCCVVNEKATALCAAVFVLLFENCAPKIRGGKRCAVVIAGSMWLFICDRTAVCWSIYGVRLNWLQYNGAVMLSTRLSYAASHIRCHRPTADLILPRRRCDTTRIARQPQSRIGTVARCPLHRNHPLTQRSSCTPREPWGRRGRCASVRRIATRVRDTFSELKRFLSRWHAACTRSHTLHVNYLA